MTARLLTILALTLPLTACAAQQTGSGQAVGATTAATTSAGQDTRPAAQAPAAAPAPVVPEPAAAPAHPAAPQSTPSATPAATHSRAVAAPQTPTVQPDTAAAPTGTAAPANPAVPDVAAPRPATPGVATPGAPTPGATVPPVTMPSGSSTGSLLQTLFALIIVLAVLGALAWFLKRYGPKVGGGNANVRVVGSLNLGGRERIVVVEVGNEWIVVGASPGRINALATMPRQDGQNGDTGDTNAALAPHTAAAHSFADWLKQTIDKRK